MDAAAPPERQAEWDRLDRAQSKISEYHWKIVMEQMSQISSLVGGLATLRQDFERLRDDQGVQLERARALGEQRAKQLEKAAAESTEEYAAKLESVQIKLQDLYGQVKSERDSHEGDRSSLFHRISYLERVVGESLDKHAKHSNNLDDIHRKIVNIDGHHASVEQSIRHLQKTAQETADGLAKHAQDLEAFQPKIHDVHNQLRHEKDERQGCQTTLQDRVRAVEQAVSDFEKVKSRHDQRLEAAWVRLLEERDVLDQHKVTLATIGQRLDSVDHVSEHVRECALHLERHSKELDTIRKDCNDVNNKITAEHELHEKHHASLQHRVLDIEERHERHARDSEFIHASLQDMRHRLTDFDSRVIIDRGTSDGHHNATQQRLDILETLLTEVRTTTTSGRRPEEAALPAVLGGNALNWMHLASQGLRQQRQASLSAEPT